MSAKQARFAGRHSFVQRLRTPPGHWINAAKPNGGSDAVAMEPAVRQAARPVPVFPIPNKDAIERWIWFRVYDFNSLGDGDIRWA
jgi:hypothetical protein